MMAVAIFDHQPSAGELLDHRMTRGWRPTPTATCDGDVILGYAACRVRNAPTQSDRASGRLTDGELPRQNDHMLGGDR